MGTHPIFESDFDCLTDPSIRPDEIKAEFKEFGEIKDVRIPIDYDTREPRGFAYVDFKEVESAIEARDIINGRILFDRKVQIYYSNGTRKNSSEMVAQKKFVKLQKQLKSTREAVDEAVREQIEKPDPSKSNVKGTLHFLKVASELEATKRYQTKYVTRIRIDDRIPKEKTSDDERRERRENFRDDRKPRRRRSSSSSRSRSRSSSYDRHRSRSRSRSRSYSRSHRSRKYSESSSLSRSPSPRNFRVKKSKRKRSRRRTPSSSRSRSPSRSRRHKKRSKRHRKRYSSSSSNERSPSRSRRYRKCSRSMSSSSRSPTPRKKHSKKSKRKRKRHRSSSSRSRSRSIHRSSRRK